MHLQSRTDWAQYDPISIPSKTTIPGFDAWLAEIELRRRSAGPAWLIDIGCGNGVVSKRSAARGFRVVGLDINQAAIAVLSHEFAETSASFITCDVADSAGFPVPEALFDAAVCQLVISVIGDAADRAQLLRNTARALGPGGSLFISLSGVSDDINPAYAELYSRDAAATGEFGSYFSRDAAGRVLYRTHHFGAEETLRLLSDAGFTDIDIVEHIEVSSRRHDQRARFLYVTCRNSLTALGTSRSHA